MKVWVSRDKDNRNIDTAFFSSKPKPDCDGSMFEGDFLAEMRSKNFKALFGFTPRKGSIGQYELSLKEIKCLNQAKIQ